MESEVRDIEDLKEEDQDIEDSEDPEEEGEELEEQELTDRLALESAEHSIRLLVADIIRVAYRPLRPVDVLEVLSCLRHLQVLDL